MCSIFFFKQKTAYEMRISDWSSDVCSSDLIADGLLVDREDAAGGAVLGRHIADGRLVGQGQVVEAVAVELDELADDALGAQHLHHGQHQIGDRKRVVKGKSV